MRIINIYFFDHNSKFIDIFQHTSALLKWQTPFHPFDPRHPFYRAQPYGTKFKRLARQVDEFLMNFDDFMRLHIRRRCVAMACGLRPVQGVQTLVQTSDPWI